MNIAIVSHNLSIVGGAQRVVAVEASLLRKRGHNVTLVFPGAISPVLRNLVSSDVELRRIRVPPSQTWLFRHAISAVQLASVLRKVDIVHPHNYPTHIWTHWAMRLTYRHVHSLWYCQEPYRRIYPVCGSAAPGRESIRMGQRAKLRPADIGLSIKRRVDRCLDRSSERAMGRSVVNSVYSRKAFESVYRRVPTIIYPSVVDGAGIAQLGQGESGDFVLGVVGRLETSKNVGTVLKAVATLRMGGGGRVCCRIVGEGRLRAELEQLASTLGCDENVEFLGALSDEELANFYDSCHAIAFVPYEEPFGLVAVEAAAHGRPVIASRYGGPSEIVTDGETGLLVEPGDHAAVASAIARLVGGRDKCTEMGRNARRRWEERFSREVFVLQMEAVFEELVAVVGGQ